MTSNQEIEKVKKELIALYLIIKIRKRNDVKQWTYQKIFNH